AGETAPEVEFDRRDLLPVELPGHAVGEFVEEHRGEQQHGVGEGHEPGSDAQIRTDLAEPGTEEDGDDDGGEEPRPGEDERCTEAAPGCGCVAAIEGMPRVGSSWERSTERPVLSPTATASSSLVATACPPRSLRW